MPKLPKNFKDVEYYVRGRKRRIAGSTKATSDFLALVHSEHPTATISQLREIITDRTQYILCPEALEVLEVIKAAKFVVDRDFPVEYVDRRPGDSDVLVADIQKAKETIGWKPERNLSHMIWDAYQWHRDHPDGYGDKKQPGRW